MPYLYLCCATKEENMKKCLPVLWISLIILTLGCFNRDLDITMKMTNPSNKPVPFKLGYTPPNTGEIQVRDYTPKEYTVSIKKDEILNGWVIKDTFDILEVVHFQLLVNGEERLVDDITLGYIQRIDFQAKVE